MRVGINQVLLYERSSGARQRELSLMPELLRQLTDLGHGAVVYVDERLQQDLVDELVPAASSALVVRAPVPAVPTIARVLRGESYFPRRIKEDHLDLFHTNYFPVVRTTAPLILTLHDLRFVHQPQTYTRSRLLFLRWAVPLSLRRAQRIIADSSDTKRDAQTYFGTEESKIDVIPIPVGSAFKRVTEQARLEHVRLKYGLPERYILYVGHLEPRKNLHRLLQAFLLLSRQVADMPHLVILGKESYGNDALFAELRNSRLSNKVRFTGYVDEIDMPAAYSLAEMLVFPSLHEGFGIPILEAMACGVPVVTSNIAAMPEVAGNAAVLVDPAAVESIASGIACLLNQPALRNELVERGYAHVRNFTAERSARLTIESYERALDAPPERKG